MDNIKIIDCLNISKDKEFLKIIDNNEKIYYSKSLVKVNQSGKNQERNFVITNKNVYNCKKKNLKGKISLTSILGMTYSTKSDEFIIHLKTEQHDYTYISKDKIIIICLIASLYQKLDTTMIIHICEINEKSLKNYITYDKDKKKNKYLTKMNLAFRINTKSFLEANKQYIEKSEDEINDQNNEEENIFKDFIIVDDNKKIDHFKVIKEIERDVFGTIFIAEYLKDNKKYLLKSISKECLLNNDLLEQKILEKNILQKYEFPFIYKMVFCFQKEDKIYFVFNYIKTDNLYNQLCLYRFFPEDKVKFYASIIGLTLEFLHKNKLVYRDFNLKHISVDEEGFLLFDKFHNVKLIEERDDVDIKFCGEVEYCPPEVILGEKYSKISDWWCFGIIIYEMLFGVQPFLNDGTDKIYNMILNEEIKFPNNVNISAEAKDLLQKLLIKEKNDRLGFEGGFEVIKKHYFFKGIDFDNLVKKQIVSSFKPIINNEKDENFNLFNCIDSNLENISEIHLDFIKKNEDKFFDFYE